MGLAKWYLHKLRTYPIRTNLASAFVLMTVGDVMAQWLEQQHHIDHSFLDGHDELAGKKREPAPTVRRLSLRRYGTHGPIDKYLPVVSANDRGEKGIPQQGEVYEETDNTSSSWDSFSRLQSEITFLDPYRIVTMVAWNVTFTTPTFLYFYRICDRIFVPPTVWTIGARVMATLMLSIPINALFFTYGTCVHHTAEWYSLSQDLKQALLEDVGCTDFVADDVMRIIAPFDWPLMSAKVQLKIESELLDTIQKAAAMWAPINAVSFAFVPPHLRPLWMMFFSVFWNCYLSIVQHRDLVVPMNA